MRKTRKEINYQTCEKIGRIISSSRDMTTVCKRVVKVLPEELGLKGAALMLLNRRTKELKVAASHGLSAFYLNKGPISSLKSIAESLSDGPVAIYNVRDDPRLQYPEEANREGIESILSVPLMLRGKPQGVLRLYTSEPWEFSMQDITFVQAIAQMLALVLDNIRIAGAYKTSIELLKVMRPVGRARG